jgi:hypothetical protein
VESKGRPCASGGLEAEQPRLPRTDQSSYKESY